MAFLIHANAEGSEQEASLGGRNANAEASGQGDPSGGKSANAEESGQETSSGGRSASDLARVRLVRFQGDQPLETNFYTM